VSTFEAIAAAFGCAMFFTALLILVASAFEDDDE
jgi:hypothetical protein